MNISLKLLLGVCLLAARTVLAEPCAVRGTGDLGVVIERADGSVLVVDTSATEVLHRVSGLGDLSHASAVFSRDGRYAYVFGRDGGLSKVDLLCGRVAKRVVQAGNSIGGAISQDGGTVAVSNYEPGGVNLFDAETLEPLRQVPARTAQGQSSKVVGLVDAPGGRFVYSLYDAGEIRVLAPQAEHGYREQRFADIGRNPYDGLITPDGRYYVAGLFGEDGLALLDLWHPEQGVRRILSDYGKGDRKLPVYKMPHLEGWARAGDKTFIPGVGRHQLLVLDRQWRQTASIDIHGQPVFAVARPDGRQVWVNFALPDNDTVQVIDTETLEVIKTLKPGKAVLHMEFSPRGEQVWISVRDEDRVKVYDTANFQQLDQLQARKPSGIFFTARAHRIGL